MAHYPYDNRLVSRNTITHHLQSTLTNSRRQLFYMRTLLDQDATQNPEKEIQEQLQYAQCIFQMYAHIQQQCQHWKEQSQDQSDAITLIERQNEQLFLIAQQMMVIITTRQESSGYGQIQDHEEQGLHEQTPPKYDWKSDTSHESAYLL